jgi:hypothetical protein
MSAEEWNMKERIWKGRMEYSVLKEKMKENECGWSKTIRTGACIRLLRRWIQFIRPQRRL